MMHPPDPHHRQTDLAGAGLTPELTPEPVECVDTEQVPGPLRAEGRAAGHAPWALALYLVLGVGFGALLVESQVVSWYRIQEMFRFDSFHLYGVIGSAVATAALSLWAIRRLGLRTLHGEPIEIAPKQWGASRLPGGRYTLGGLTFGFGWALLGACPAPILALLGGGIGTMAIALVAALAGTWTYGLLRDRLPH